MALHLQRPGVLPVLSCQLNGVRSIPQKLLELARGIDNAVSKTVGPSHNLLVFT